MKKLNRIAIMKYNMIGKVSESSVPAIDMIIILNIVIDRPLRAVPIVNLATHDSER